jgi:hypothetical protein
MEVVADPDMTTQEKRAILASWGHRTPVPLGGARPTPTDRLSARPL